MRFRSYKNYSVAVNLGEAMHQQLLFAKNNNLLVAFYNRNGDCATQGFTSIEIYDTFRDEILSQ